MTEPISMSAAGAGGVRPPDKSTSARSTESAGAGAAFKALLESLEKRADQLEKKSESDLSRENLAAAVGDARKSLDEMLSLKDRVLEEWRAAEQQSRAKS